MIRRVAWSGADRFDLLTATRVLPVSEVQPMFERDLESLLHAYDERVDLAYWMGPMFNTNPPVLQPQVSGTSSAMYLASPHKSPGVLAICAETRARLVSSAP